MGLALDEARQAPLKQEVPIGAVLAYEGEVLARAHNLKENLKDPTAHAELLVIKEASRKLERWRLNGVHLYVTMEPCAMCAGAMVQARVSRLIFGVRDPKAGACGSIFNVPQEPRLNHRLEVLHGVLEQEIQDLLQGFFGWLRAERKRPSFGDDPLIPCTTNVDGEMAERLKAPDSKSGMGATPSGVQIPLSPPPVRFRRS